MLFSSNRVITVFQDIIQHSHTKFAEMQEDGPYGGTILAAARVDAWTVAVAEGFTRNKKSRQTSSKLSADNYIKNLIEVIH